MITLHFPESIWQPRGIRKRWITMHRPQSESFVIQVRGSSSSSSSEGALNNYNHHEFPPAPTTSVASNKLNFSAMKLFNRFRKILMRLVFSFPSGGGSSGGGSSGMASKQRNSCDRFDPPKTSCSSYYSSQMHYSEAIADCIEFLNRSSQDGILDGRKSDVLV
ncbi:hypothetical protein Tsubulata_037105 [Turnera subulata]|uniref:Uncharacterized protein n=1 Tax=Turnera subulata TaxID=218843 RepID=A0A9Q0G1N5_9ROSI|nr:hypothetical protein Tsubulata_037105 [Turnera subulata]